MREKQEGRERDQWEIERENVTKTKLIGSGHFGEVWKSTISMNSRCDFATLKPPPHQKYPSNFIKLCTELKATETYGISCTFKCVSNLLRYQKL